MITAKEALELSVGEDVLRRKLAYIEDSIRDAAKMGHREFDTCVREHELADALIAILRSNGYEVDYSYELLKVRW